MTDEEIEQLSDLKRDRDKLKRNSGEAFHLERTYDRSEEASLKERMIHYFVKVKNTSKKMTIGTREATLTLDGYDYRNTVVMDRVRLIQSKALQMIEKDLDILIEEVEASLKNYKGQPVSVYIKETIGITDKSQEAV